jgi:hypothetical protein
MIFFTVMPFSNSYHIQISALSESSLTPLEILKDVVREVAPDQELAPKKEKLKPEATLVRFTLSD